MGEDRDHPYGRHGPRVEPRVWDHMNLGEAFTVGGLLLLKALLLYAGPRLEGAGRQRVAREYTIDSAAWDVKSEQRIRIPTQTYR